VFDRVPRSSFNPQDSEVPLPRVDFIAVGHGFAVTCTDDEASKLGRLVLGVGQLLTLHGHVSKHF
jgi:hypothetical protein